MKTLREVKGASRHRVRADLRRRETRRRNAVHWKTRNARAHQSGGVRRLRRLFGAIELHFGRNLETEFGRKRTINQSSCNKDYSCLKGFCPSFVTVDGGKLRKARAGRSGDIGELPEPARGPRSSGPTTSPSAASAAPAAHDRARSGWLRISRARPA